MKEEKETKALLAKEEAWRDREVALLKENSQTLKQCHADESKLRDEIGRLKDAVVHEREDP